MIVKLLIELHQLNGIVTINRDEPEVYKRIPIEIENLSLMTRMDEKQALFIEGSRTIIEFDQRIITPNTENSLFILIPFDSGDRLPALLKQKQFFVVFSQIPQFNLPNGWSSQN